MSLENPLAARVVAGFLKAGRVLDNASSVLLLGTLVLARGPLSALVLIVVGLALALAVAAKYLAWRVALDAEFFTLLHEQPTQTAAFDAGATGAGGWPLAGQPLPGCAPAGYLPGPAGGAASRWRAAGPYAAVAAPSNE